MAADRASTPVVARVVAILGGLLFVGSLLFFLDCFARRFDPNVESLRAGPVGLRVAADVLLFSVFALHHSLFARPFVKSTVARLVPPALERSVYVWASSLLFIAICSLWQPVPGVLWTVTGFGRAFMTGLQAVAVVFTVVTASRLDFLDLAGVRQVFAPHEDRRPAILDRGPYRFVRHPIYLGWFAMVWLPPTMNGTRLVFSITSCVYLLLAVPFEERDLRRQFGDAYDRYAASVRWRILPYLFSMCLVLRA